MRDTIADSLVAKKSLMNPSLYFFGYRTRCSSLQSLNRCARLRESNRALRDGSFAWRCSRHFVPGYDRTVLRDKSHSPIEGPRIKLGFWG
jgi:hypothetical protein